MASPDHNGQAKSPDELWSKEETDSRLKACRCSSSLPNLHAFSAHTEEITAKQSEGHRRQSVLRLWRKIKFDNYRHKERFYSTISILYAILIMVLGVCLPIAELFGNNKQALYVGSFEGFYVYLFLTSISFFVFAHLIIVRDYNIPRWLTNIVSLITSNCGGWQKAKNEVTQHSGLSDDKLDSDNVRKGQEVNNNDNNDNSNDNNDNNNNNNNNKNSMTLRSHVNKNMTLNSHAHSGSFYLRLGAIGFGIGNMIHEGLHFGVFFEHGLQVECIKLSALLRPVLQLCFTFWQMYFIFRNSKIIIHRYRLIARLGLMHLVATNLCVWFRVVVIETIHELHAYLHDSSHDSLHDSSHSDDGHSNGHEPYHNSNYNYGNNTHRYNQSYHKTINVISTTSSHGSLQQDGTTCPDPYSSAHPGLITAAVDGVSPYLYACTVEFSLIMAGIMYLTWSNVARRSRSSSDSDGHSHPHGPTPDHHVVPDHQYSEDHQIGSDHNAVSTHIGSDRHIKTDYHIIQNHYLGEDHNTKSHHNLGPDHSDDQPSEGSDKLKRVTVDCSGSNRGLFIGIFSLMATIICLVLFFALSSGASDQSHRSGVSLMYVMQLVLYAATIIAVCGAAYQFRVLKFSSTGSGSHLDEILLLIALIGNYVFCIFSAISNSHQLHVTMGPIAMVTSLAVMIQSTIQTLFILNGLRRSAYTAKQVEQKPGKQYITFLVIANSAMWAVNSFELLRADSSPIELQFYGTLPWSLITHISMPLAIFYRYHSTVCLADVWKDAYKIKSAHGHH